MKSLLLMTSLAIFLAAVFLNQFSNGRLAEKVEQAGFDTALQAEQELIKRGEHLVLIGACHDCHSPKKMTEKGMEIDFSRALSGHPSDMPPPDVNRKEMEQKGLAVTQTLTAWVGPWGISYAANLTSDATGIGNWTEKHFFTAIRQGKHKGLENNRMLLPPMPWDMYRNMTDEELRAVFAYLKSTKPIKNVVPAPQPPVTAAATGK
ncbi:diheme cytochrome c-553 [Pontibacter sp. HJ8]